MLLLNATQQALKLEWLLEIISLLLELLREMLAFLKDKQINWLWKEQILLNWLEELYAKTVVLQHVIVQEQ